MDPAACVVRAVDAFADRDLNEFCYACDDLATWLSRGGFTPDNIKSITSKMLATLRKRGFHAPADVIARARA